MWLNIEEQFVGNRLTRALILDADFRTFSQGDLTITEYCTKMKTMADALGDLGEPVLDRTLVLTILRGSMSVYTCPLTLPGSTRFLTLSLYELTCKLKRAS